MVDKLELAKAMVDRINNINREWYHYRVEERNNDVYIKVYDQRELVDGAMLQVDEIKLGEKFFL